MQRPSLTNIKKVYKLAWLLLPGTILLSFLSSMLPQAIEALYSDGINLYVRIALSKASGILNFSIAEIILAAIFLAFFFLLARLIIRLVHGKNRFTMMASFTAQLLSCAGILYFLFFLLWGANYHRLPFSKLTGMEIKPSSVSELEQLCQSLVRKAAELEPKLYPPKSSVLSKDQICNMVEAAYESLSVKYKMLAGSYSTPKRIKFSPLLSYAGISGFYFPFTAEANVNEDIPLFMLPATACHEAAHQRGFAREDEANYIAYLACLASDQDYYKYSGICLALIYSMNALYDDAPLNYQKIRKTYTPGLKKDFLELNSFWEKYDGPIDKFSTKINNTYLKANNQSDGVKSYGRMVDLLLAAHKTSK